MTFSPRGILLPPPRYRGGFWLTGAIAFVLVLVVLLALPHGRATGDPVPADQVSVDLTDDVALQLEPELRDRGWRGPDWAPYTLDLRATVENAGDEVFPRTITVTVVRDPGTSTERTLSERWAGNLELANVPADDSAAYNLSFNATDGCGDFLATVSFLPSLSSDRSEEVEVPFTVGGENCRAG